MSVIKVYDCISFVPLTLQGSTTADKSKLVFVYILMYTWMYVLYVCVCVCIYKRMYVCLYVCVLVCMIVCMCVLCMYECMYPCLFVCLPVWCIRACLLCVVQTSLSLRFWQNYSALQCASNALLNQFQKFSNLILPFSFMFTILKFLWVCLSRTVVVYCVLFVTSGRTNPVTWTWSCGIKSPLCLIN